MFSASEARKARGTRPLHRGEWKMEHDSWSGWLVGWEAQAQAQARHNGHRMNEQCWSEIVGLVEVCVEELEKLSFSCVSSDPVERPSTSMQRDDTLEGRGRDPPHPEWKSEHRTRAHKWARDRNAMLERRSTTRKGNTGTQKLTLLATPSSVSATPLGIAHDIPTRHQQRLPDQQHCLPLLP